MNVLRNEALKIKNNNTYTTTSNPEEVEKFSKLSNEWWDINGSLKLLHLMNPFRITYIKSQLNRYAISKSLNHLKVLDVGCGAGILSEVK